MAVRNLPTKKLRKELWELMINLRIPIVLMVSGLVIGLPATAWSAVDPVARKVDSEVTKDTQTKDKAAGVEAAKETSQAQDKEAEETEAGVAGIAELPKGMSTYSSESGNFGFGKMLLWMVLVLILVVGGMLLLTHFLKRFPGLSQRRGERMEIEESLSLTPKASVHIINVEGERRLIGTNDGAITHLAHLDSYRSQESKDE